MRICGQLGRDDVGAGRELCVEINLERGGAWWRGAAAQASGSPTAAGRAILQRRLTNEVRVLVERREAGAVLVTDAYYPGWRAAVDGREVVPAIGDYLFRAVPVGRGSHRVQMVFWPGTIVVGLFGLLVGVAGLSAAAASVRRKRLSEQV